MDDSEFLAHEPCPKCGSKDNLARYTDGHGYCFGCGYLEQASNSAEDSKVETQTKKSGVEPALETVHSALPKRALSQKTCEKWSYTTGTYNGRPVQIANYKDNSGRTVAQKLRFPDKSFAWLGDVKAVDLYGRHLWRDGGKMIVVTEGEIDALSVSQVWGNKWPVVSVKNGANGAKACLKKGLDWLERFETVVLLFDQDEAGKKAAAECAPLFSPGKCKIASLPLKDANEMLVEGRDKELVDAIWGAKEFRPDGLVTVADILDDIVKPVEHGLPWFLPALTKMTFGRRHREVYTFGAGTGIGKTDFITQQVAFDVTELGLKVGLIFLEQKPSETGKRVAGKAVGKRFHIPDDSWSKEELLAAVKGLGDRIVMYDNFGETDWEVVKGHIRYMASALDTRVIYLDHLTAMADPSNERESLETLMKELAMLANELNLIVHLVSHLSTPDGTPHEEGGRVMIRHFKGARAIGFWSYFMFGLERDQQHETAALREVTTLRVLKDRYTGQATGQTIHLSYEVESGRLIEMDHDPFEAEKHFTPHQGGDHKDF